MRRRSRVVRAVASIARARKQSRRLLRRAVAVCACMAVSALGLAAAPAAPARAALVGPARVGALAAPPARAVRAAVAATAARTATTARAALADGPATFTYPGGDLVVSMDDGGLDPSAATQAIKDFETSLGLSAGADLGSVIQALYQKNAGVRPYFTAPPAFRGGSLSVSGSTITATVPAADLPDFSANLNGVVAGLLGAIIGGLSAAVIFAVCEAVVFLFTGPGVAWVTPVCTSVSWFFWSFIGIAFADWAEGIPLDANAWTQILTYSLVNAGLGLAWPFLGSFIAWAVPRYLTTASQSVRAAIQRVASWFGSAAEAGAAEAATGGALEEAAGAAPVELGDIVSAAGMASPNATGTVTSGFAGYCMDAYGANASEGIQPGQIAAINVCNGNSNQDFTVWSNNSITVIGMCMDTGGGTDGDGAKLVNLTMCDGSDSQVWTQVGNSLVNKATGDCLDDPNANTSPGTQLRIWPCNGSQAQQWALPSRSLPSNASSCDIYGYYGTPCVAAYSTTRALYARYNGPLYQVQRASDGTTDNIGLLTAGGYVNAAGQDSFCSGTMCTITEIYDQSPFGNNLTVEGAGGAAGADHGADAAALPITIDGHEAYGLDIAGQTGYRDNSTTAVAISGEAEGMYMVASGTHVNKGCCFDFGNAETNTRDNGNGHMDAVNLSTTCYFAPCTGSGPWVQADMENGLFEGGNGSNTANLGNSSDFVTAMLKNNGRTTYALKGGNAQSGGLTTWYSGPLPNIVGYMPMHQEGAVVLGTGGDNSNSSVGSFFEGVMTAGYPSDAADNAVQADIVAAGYAGNSGNPPSGVASTAPTTGETPSAAGQAVVHAAGATGAGANGFSSVYTVDASKGHLQETYLPYMGDSWTTQDLSATYGTPPVKAGTQPVAVVHCGYTSIFTVDASNGDLQETYLPAVGQGWSTQDLSANYGTPPTDVTPTAVVHYSGATGAAAACGFTSVYTVDANGDLQETYLTAIGQGWSTQDLSANYGTPAVLAGTSPVAIVHCGWTSVYTVDANEQLQETYLSAIGAPWGTQSLSAKYGTPLTTTTPAAVVHGQGATAPDSCGWTSVYTVDVSNGDLQESYLSDVGFPGDPWQTQNLSANYGTPPVLAGTDPAALVHMGYTSVYTVDQGSDQLQETYLPEVGFPGDSWGTQSLSAKYGTPPTVSTPVVLLHPDASGNLDWTSVYTVDAVNAYQTDLQETYLSNVGFPGDSWVAQDLSAKYGTPAVFVAFSQ